MNPTTQQLDTSVELRTKHRRLLDPDPQTQPAEQPARVSIFVFGSNTKGIHGAGAAKFARLKRGARQGQPTGLQGTSYAIPTREALYHAPEGRNKFVTLQLGDIGFHVGIFLAFARANPELDFEVTNIGCGLAGYEPAQIAPLFLGAPDNCHFTVEFRHHMREALAKEM